MRIYADQHRSLLIRIGINNVNLIFIDPHRLYPTSPANSGKIALPKQKFTTMALLRPDLTSHLL